MGRGHRSAVRWGELIVGKVGDRDLVARILRQHQIEDVVHFAASAYVGESVIDPGQYFRNNVAETVGLLEAMRDSRVRNIVFSSTCATYGVPQRLPIDEFHPQSPVNPYGHSKLFVETRLKAFEAAHGLRWIALRYFNAAGAHPDGTLGENHDPETHLIPNVVKASRGSAVAVDIYGTDYPTDDGTAVRDYIHVCDLASAHALAVDYLARGESSCAFNLGTGAGYSVNEVIAEVERQSGTRVERRLCPRRAGDPPALVANPQRARDLLGWEPVHSSLQEIVETASRYFERSSDREAS